MMKHAFACAAVAAAMAFGALSLAGCDAESEAVGSLQGGSESNLINEEEFLKQQIEEGLSAEIEGLLGDEDQLADAIMNTTLSDLAGYGIDGVEFVQDYLGNLDYNIGDINVNGETATVAVTLNFKSLADLAATVGGDLVDFAAGLNLEDLPLDKIGALVMPVISAAAGSVDQFLSQELLLDFQLVNGEWQLTDQAKLAIASALLEG